MKLLTDMIVWRRDMSNDHDCKCDHVVYFGANLRNHSEQVFPPGPFDRSFRKFDLEHFEKCIPEAPTTAAGIPNEMLYFKRNICL